MKIEDIKAGLIVRLRNRKPYGSMQVRAVLPKGAHGRKARLVEVAHSSAPNDTSFRFALIKVFRAVDLEAAP